MRRLTLVLLLVLAAAAAPQLLAQSQDPLIVSARQFAQQGNYDTAINMLRGALASRPNDAALKSALLDVLLLKYMSLSTQLADLKREIAAMQGHEPTEPRPPFRAPTAGCGTWAPVRVGGSVTTPIKLVDVKPIYPPMAQSAKVQGIVIIEATIDCNGDVTDAKVLRGQPLLNEAALESVKQWKYSQTLLNGVPVPVIMTVTVTFSVR